MIGRANSFSLSFGWAILTVAALFAPGRAWALACESSDGGVDILEDIGSPVAVPPDLPDGSIIWTSPHRNFNVRCFKDLEIRMAEYVYFYPNPLHTALQGIEFGIRYQGMDYWTGARVRTTHMIAACPEEISLSECPDINFNLGFQVIVRTREFTGEVRPGEFPVFQFDGELGINGWRKNLLYTLTGLEKIRFLECSPRLTIFPESSVLDFGVVNPPDPGQKVSSKLFEVRVAANGCHEPVELHAGFTTRGARYDEYTIQPTLAGTGIVNEGIGFQVVDRELGSLIRLDAPFLLARMPSQGEALASFLVSMIGVPKPVQIGPFEGTLLLFVNYQ